jgi:hypothetical protein
MKSKNVDIIPTKDEVKEILAQIFQAQTNHIIQITWKPENIQNAPIVLVQAWLGRMMLKAFDKINSEYDKSANEFRAEVEKAIKGFENEVRSVFE